ncbi:MAG: phosphoribosyl-AMP cyclohydrolase [Alphaproteobacteria bacterium]|nr:phosphoribosyl-AMP cyclohydrolase [Alphaproteobacteria bacterium]
MCNSSSFIDNIIKHIKFNEQGLVPAIAQQFDSQKVLMMAWMNKESVEETIKTKTVCYFSRSRNKQWRKGETSGHTQKLVDLRIDCDGDTLLLLVNQIGAACHTGRETCFYKAMRGDNVEKICDPLVDIVRKD